MSKEKIKFNIVDKETGEIVNTMEDGDKVIRKKSIKLMEETSEINKNEAFIKIFVKPLLQLSTVLSNSEAWFVTYLLSYLDYTSGMIKDNNGNSITLDDMMDDTSLKPSATYNMIKKLTDKGIIAKIKTENKTYFVMNPYIFMKGKRVNNTLIDVFKNTQWANLFKSN